MQSQFVRKKSKQKRKQEGRMLVYNQNGICTHPMVKEPTGLRIHARVLVLHYDPFGLPPPTELVRYLRPARVFYTTKRDLNLESKIGGRLCIHSLNRIKN